jgi:DNA-binding Lrp family transcriptional regulator
MRGSKTPHPVYTEDINGLLQWLKQPPSKWSAVGWRNALAWSVVVELLISDMNDAEARICELQEELDVERSENCHCAMSEEEETP